MDPRNMWWQYWLQNGWNPNAPKFAPDLPEPDYWGGVQPSERIAPPISPTPRPTPRPTPGFDVNVQPTRPYLPPHQAVPVPSPTPWPSPPAPNITIPPPPTPSEIPFEGWNPNAPEYAPDIPREGWGGGGDLGEGVAPPIPFHPYPSPTPTPPPYADVTPPPTPPPVYNPPPSDYSPPPTIDYYRPPDYTNPPPRDDLTPTPIDRYIPGDLTNPPPNEEMPFPTIDQYLPPDTPEMDIPIPLPPGVSDVPPEEEPIPVPAGAGELVPPPGIPEIPEEPAGSTFYGGSWGPNVISNIGGVGGAGGSFFGTTGRTVVPGGGPLPGAFYNLGGGGPVHLWGAWANRIPWYISTPNQPINYGGHSTDAPTGRRLTPAEHAWLAAGGVRSGVQGPGIFSRFIPSQYATRAGVIPDRRTPGQAKTSRHTPAKFTE